MENVTAYQIADYTANRVFDNLKMSLRISLPIIVLAILLVSLLGFSEISRVLEGEVTNGVVAPGPAFGLRAFIAIIVVVYSYYWIAVAWHRFLLEGMAVQGIFPQNPVGSIFSYIWGSIVVGFVILLILLVPVFIAFAVTGGEGINFSVGDYSGVAVRGAGAISMNFVFTVSFAYIFLRYSPVLVTSAIGKSETCKASRKLTCPGRKIIFQLALGYGVVTLVWAFIGGLGLGQWLIELAVGLFFSWVAFIFSITILTSIYEVFVLGVDLNVEREVRQ
ncbi:hypothetical protein [Candidatus Halocynthiibacter alkanivorans]|uniref:hypothetical protein n=1 Tax=Candidatus Halocynthiibacter alkanivorans TaxID=2267619 RepID=UPI000DF2E8E2|nr:hypothetical protein [Candidatus Halocynthiibacter alkanivorans]